jgi:diguanylate cyclase (GGDEF)-like protein/PAS domain S-box-containing protein
VSRRAGKRAQDITAAIYARRKALADLMRSEALGEGNLAQAVWQITETAAHALEVERTSVWRIVEGGSALECIDLYERSKGQHGAGAMIRATDVPRYFAALQQERSICADDARVDPRTSEFTPSYLEPNGITAMLDAPVFVRGKMVGVVCHEHTGSPRKWEFSEELLAGTFADFVALVIETGEWQRAEEALRVERDALETKVAQRTSELQDSESSLRALLEFSPVAMVMTRASDHAVAFANRRAAAMFEVPLDQIIGQRAPDYWVVPAEREHFLAELYRQGRVDHLEVQLRSHRGRVFWCRVSAQRLRFGGEDTLLGAMIDITDQKAAQDRLHQLATHDALTGIYNRRHLEEVVRLELERAQRYTRPLTVAMLDADHFKRINDTYGHQVGDEVLRTVSQRCQKTLRASDVLGRYGGEEFVVVFPETALDEARMVAERLRAAVAGAPVTVGEQALLVTISIGLAGLSRGQDHATLLARADSALYAAKQSGRNRVQVAKASAGD